MRILFITEATHLGKTPRDYPNMRTEFAWQYLLDADHLPLSHVKDEVKCYDIILVVLPKKGNVASFALVNHLKKHAKVGIIQEGPNDYWHNYDIAGQIEHSDALKAADFILTHNYEDVGYYRFFNKAAVIKSAMPDWLEFPEVEREGIMIGGNFCQWYNGFDSYEIAKVLQGRIGGQIFAPSMGRRIQGEELLVNHLPYMNHQDFLSHLNRMKVGVHLMRTFAAGTFALNCAFFDIPCIGYDYLDTQRVCHPMTSTSAVNLNGARNIAETLPIYKAPSISPKERYNTYFHSSYFKDDTIEAISKMIS